MFKLTMSVVHLAASVQLKLQIVITTTVRYRRPNSSHPDNSRLGLKIHFIFEIIGGPILTQRLNTRILEPLPSLVPREMIMVIPLQDPDSLSPILI
jgi:hypothetical protein